MKGLQLLKLRNRIKYYDFTYFEKRYELKVPPIYRKFISLFHLESFNTDYYYNISTNTKYPLNGPIHVTNLGDTLEDLYSFAEFIDPIDIFYLYDEDFEADDYKICSKKLIPIGISGVYNSGGGFLLGTAGKLADKIIVDLDTVEQEGRFIEIADDIFSFVSSFVQKEFEVDYVKKDFNRNNLYKNWGEDFWRIED